MDRRGFEERQPANDSESAREVPMTADYNGWNDAPEAEREAMDLYSGQELQREALAELKRLRKSALQLREYVRTMGYWDLRPAA
jgi:hypothetical protein